MAIESIICLVFTDNNIIKERCVFGGGDGFPPGLHANLLTLCLILACALLEGVQQDALRMCKFEETQWFSLSALCRRTFPVPLLDGLLKVVGVFLWPVFTRCHRFLRRRRSTASSVVIGHLMTAGCTIIALCCLTALAGVWRAVRRRVDVGDSTHKSSYLGSPLVVSFFCIGSPVPVTSVLRLLPVLF